MIEMSKISWPEILIICTAKIYVLKKLNLKPEEGGIL